MSMQFTSTAVEPPNNGTKPSEVGARQGGTYFTVCCDYRRAVVVLGILGVIWQGILFSISIFAIIAQMIPLSEDTDMMGDAGKNGAAVVLTGLAVLFAIVFGLAMCFFGLHILGALKYSKCMLGCALVLDTIFFAIQLWYTFAMSDSGGTVAWNIVLLVPWLFCIYGLVGLVKEINSGIMSEETYPREAYSCCCLPNV